jgi:hypothetical protein
MRLFLNRSILNRSNMPLAAAIALVVSLSSANLRAAQQQTAKSPAVPANRFLCIYDISAPMHKHLAAVQKSTREIFQSRCSGQLHYGDSLGVWSFDQELHTGFFPLELWKPDQEDETTLRIIEFLKEQHTGNGSRLDQVMDGVAQVIQGPQITTVIMFSTGTNPMQGTPFDQDINDAYQRALKDMKSDRMPIVTVLQARNSKFLKYTVNALPWPAVIPELPIPIKNVASARSEPSDSANARPPDQANTNSGSVNSQPGTAAPNTPTPASPLNRAQTPPTLVLNPRTASQPAPAATPAPSPATPPPPTQPQLAASNPTGPGPNFDAKPPMPNSPAQTPAPPAPAVIQTPPPIANANAALVPKSPEHPNPGPPPARTARPVIAEMKPNPPSATPPSAVASPPTKPPTVKPNPVLNPAPAPAPVVAAKSRTNPPVQTALAVEVTGGRSKTLLIAGVSLLCLAIGLLYLTLRRIRGGGGPSLITRSMGDLRLRK